MSEFEIIETVVGKAKLKRTNRKTLAISVLPDGTLELIAPAKASEALILVKVLKRKAWIMTQRRAFKEINAVRPPSRYVSGATHRYLGRQYRLKITQAETARVSLRGGYFEMQVPQLDAVSVKKALTQWFRHRAKEQFTRRLERWNEWCRQRRLPEPRLRLLSMPKRWGSALKDGTVCLNPELIKAPSVCVDYVIAHEVCHLRHPDHGRAFWNLLSQVCPNWKQLKQRLEEG